ncbi:c-type cytochrome [Kaarinaea lacus]
MVKLATNKFSLPILIFTVLALFGVAGFVYLVIENRQAQSQNQKLVMQGEVLYGKHCASCHGVNLEGQPNWKTRNVHRRLPAPPHDETGHTWHHDDQLLFELTKFGMVPPNIPEGYESDMPAFENVLSDDEIWTVLHFIKSRWPDEIRKMQEEKNIDKPQFVKP